MTSMDVRVCECVCVCRCGGALEEQQRMRQDLVVLAQQLQDAEERALNALKGHRTDDSKSAGMVGTRGTTDLRRGKTSPSCKGTLVNRDVLSLWAVWLIGDRVACGAGSQGDQAQRAQVGD
jgi:hypothetical protein